MAKTPTSGDGPRFAMATVIAGVAAYLTVEEHGIAPIGQFGLWWIADYIIIMWLFGLLDRKQKA
jgi:hypothetical protein